MDRLVFIVEGDSELNFVNHHLIPYLYERCNPACSISAQKITTNRRLSKKGGNVSYALFENEVRRVAAQGGVAITTFLDFFRLPHDYPGFTDDSKQIAVIEDAMAAEMEKKGIIRKERFFPYIQRHEFETILYSRPESWESLLSAKQMDSLKAICSQYASPEDINGGERTSPSHRLAEIFNYDKVTDSLRVLSRIDIDTIRRCCPRFDKWVGTLDTYFQQN